MKKLFFLLLFSNLLLSQTLRKLDKEIRQIYAKISNSLFDIKLRHFYSTGFAFEKKRIITILPEVEEGETVTVYNREGEKFYGKIEGWDELTHIAVIKTQKDLKVPEFSKFSHIFPQLVLSFSLKGRGNFIIFSVYDERDGKIYIEGNTPPSFSGAPLINSGGKIIGILRGKKYSFEILQDIDWEKFYKNEEEKGIEDYRKYRMFLPGKYFLPELYYHEVSFKTVGYTYDYIIKRVNLIKEKGKIYPGFLGIIIDYEEGVGIYIKRVFENSPAEEAGLRKGDVILSFGGREYDNLTDFVDAVKNTPAGSEVKMEIKRNGEVKDIKVKLGKRGKHSGKNFEEEFKKFFKKWFEFEE